MIRLFRDRRGNITVFSAVSILTLIMVIFLSINTGSYYFEQNVTDTAADSIALSLATWESRGLNTIATLNYGMVRSVDHIRSILLLWASSIGLALAGHPSLFFYLSRRAPGVIRRLWAAGVGFSKMARKIKRILPLLVLGCYRELLRYYDINGLIYPFLPVSENKGNVALRLCVEDGEPLSLTDVMKEVQRKAGSYKPRNRFKRRLYRFLSKIFFSAVRSALQLKGLIIPQVTEEDFEKKQKIFFVAFSDRKKPFLQSIFNNDYRNYGAACAQPFGGTSFDGTWRSKLITPDPGVLKKILKGKEHGL